MDLQSIPFVGTRNYTPANRGVGDIDLVVIHDMEAPERSTTAEDVARYFATTSRQVSSHYNVDSDSVVQCVGVQNVAWCAPGTNHNGIQIEHAGYARQTAAEWLDDYSRKMLELSADLVGTLCKKYAIPVRFVGVAGLRAGEKGITTHAAASLAFKRSDHTDPGPNFPMDWYLGRVKYYFQGDSPRKRMFTWIRWYLGHGEFKPYGPKNPAYRPQVPKRVPLSWWAELRKHLPGGV